MISRKHVSLILLFLCPVFMQAQRAWQCDKGRAWADTLLKVMTTEEKIGQLFMIPVFPEKDQKHYDKVSELVSQYNVGGIICFKSGPYRMVKMTNMLQSKARIPLLVSIDAEWGLPMRLDSTMQFPLQMTLGALQDKTLIYQMGKTIARQCKRMGIHISFSPVADINNNPKNPIINLRSFGDNKEEVTERAYQYMKGLQDEGIIAVLKHFPGHGDTHADSHKELPVLDFDKKRLDSLELYPFRELIKRGATGVMVAHLFVPAYDKTKNTATTLSRSVVYDLLQKEMGFKGLVFTDALNMKGVSKFTKPGELELKALLAGNDVLLYAEDVPKAVELIKQAIKDTLITLKEIEDHVRKILIAKYFAGLNSYSPVDTTQLYSDLFAEDERWTNRMLAEKSLTLVRNRNEILPLKRLDTLKTAMISIGQKPEYDFWQRMGDYLPADTFFIDRKTEPAFFDSLQKKLSGYNLLIITMAQTNRYSFNTFSFTDPAVKFVNQIAKQKKTILALFSSPYSLQVLTDARDFQAIVMAYEPLPDIQDMAAQAICGGIGFSGKLPVTVSSLFYRGFGIETTPVRLKHTLPEDFRLTSESFSRIDSLVNDAIAEGMFPGCQIWVAKNNKVFFNKSYGKLTYEGNQSVTSSHLYDIASLTKILASAPALMKLYEEKQFTSETILKDLLPKADGTSFENLKMGDILSHQAGLKAWIPFHRTYTRDKADRETYFVKKPIAGFTVQVADSMYAMNTLADSVYTTILSSELKNKGHYLYSDLGMYLVPLIVIEKKNKDFNQFLNEEFYNKLGLPKMLFRPLEKYPLSLIAPTENDTAFRKQLIRGHVHDQGAALLGGISGHAGLFANANSVGVMMSLFINDGKYGGEQYLTRETVTRFTSCYACPANRRGLIFDKPLNGSAKNPAAKGASSLSFGHSGFTGTYTWADPKTGIVYVFLSNRVYPDAENKKIIESGIRTRILEIFIEKLNEAEKTN